MPYSPTVWVNGQAPALSAANLNKLTNELEAQAAEVGLSHTLPNWVDGAAPALTTAAPLNEMERVLDLVAADQGLSYTPTVWGAGWSPARNATNLNKMEQQAVANRNALDAPPPGEVSSPIAHLSNRASTGYWPSTNVDKYKLVSTYPPKPGAFVGEWVFYRSAIACQNGFNNISEAECIAEGWGLHVPGGGSLATFLPQGGKIGDPGNPAYQQRWCELSLQKAQSLGALGFWVDNVHPNLEAVTGGAYTQEYPNNTAYKVALLDWAQAVWDFFDPLGYTVAYNTGIVLDDTGALAAAWWPQIGPYAHYLTEEHWVYPSGNLRREGNAHWYDHWEGHRALHNVARNAGSAFLPLIDQGGDAAKNYGLGTFLLDWDGQTGAAMWANALNQVDPWNTFYANTIALGAPTGAAFRVGNLWRRNFEGGVLNVDPVVAASATITLN